MPGYARLDKTRWITSILNKKWHEKTPLILLSKRQGQKLVSSDIFEGKPHILELQM